MNDSGQGLKEEAKQIAQRIAAGEDVVSRLVTMQWFTYWLDGEEVLFTDELRTEVERVAGARLEEVRPERFPNDRVLRFHAGGLEGIQARLLAG
jgi:hypothetical protein